MTSVALTAVAIGLPWSAAVLLALIRSPLRAIAFASALVSMIAIALMLWTSPSSQSLQEGLMLLYACVACGATLVLPRRDCTARTLSGILWLLGSTLLAYSTDHLGVLVVAWISSAIPFLFDQWLGAHNWRPRLALLVSTAVLATAIVLIVHERHTLSIETLSRQRPGGMAVFALLVAAVVFRKGICPVHAWVGDAAEGGSVIPTALLLNGHFGAMLVVRLIVPLFPDTARTMFPVLSYLALATALYVAIRAVAENSPRRLIAYLALSQSACILAGLESRSAAGVTGALVHWCVVTISTVGLFAILRLLEVRFGDNLTSSAHLGLARHAPRLAVYFIVLGLALVGLPGTLSFCSQDLLIHGTLISHPLIGLLLPAATAINAITIFRLFTRLFLGKRKTGFTIMADALPRERWMLSACVVFVVAGGVFPSAIVTRWAVQTESIEQTVAGGLMTR